MQFAAGEFTPPLPGLPSFAFSQRNDSEACEEQLGRLLFGDAKSAHDFLDIDGARMSGIARGPNSRNSGCRTFPAAEQIDQDRGVEKDHPPPRVRARSCPAG